MLQVIIGDVIGIQHETRSTRDGRPVLMHCPRRWIETPVRGFHFAPTGTYHLMRPVVTQYPDRDECCRFTWYSYCGLRMFFIAEDGTCPAAPDDDGQCAHLHTCLTCARRAEDDAVVARLRRIRGA